MKYFYTIIFFLLAFGLSNNSAFAQIWTDNALPSSGSREVHFPAGQSSIGYIAGSSLLRTADGGATWAAVSTPVSTAFFSVYFPSTSVGYAVSGASVIKTTDSGSSWSLLNIPSISSTATLKSVFFIDSNTGWVCGNDSSTGHLYKTTDGGATW